MTPKEKAEELVNNMFNCDNSTPEKSMAMLLIHAKQCALIAVDEIYKLTLNIGQHLEEFEDKANYYSYWEEVKQEIEKL
jgi:hypothetical protein